MSVPMQPTEAWAAVSCGGVTDGRVLGVLLNDEPLRTLWEPGLRQGDVRLARVLITEGWRPIAEAPKDGTPVDVWCASPSDPNGGFRLVDALWDEESKLWMGAGGCWGSVTHFMPLPAPPVERAATEVKRG